VAEKIYKQSGDIISSTSSSEKDSSRVRILGEKGAARRNAFKLAFVGTVGVFAALSGKHMYERKVVHQPLRKIAVNQNCVGCTGCVAVCPTDAISVIHDTIEASDEKCVSCGYCQIACPVDGIRVLQEHFDA